MSQKNSSKMNIYLIKRLSGCDYDEYWGHVVCAKSVPQARKLAARVATNEGEEQWQRGYNSKVTLLATNAKYKVPKIILSDFNAG